MTFFQIISILLTLAGLFSYVNFRYIGLPTAIGVMLMSTAGSIILIVFGRYAPSLQHEAATLMSRINFHDTLLHGMLAFLLFAGALHVDLHDLRRVWGSVAMLAVGGLLISTVIVAALCWLAFTAVGAPLPIMHCILFGVLISPTDPIAVLAIMKGAGAPKMLETQVAGESLFNDGIGVVLFLTALEIASSGHMPSWSGLSLLLVKEILGGVGVGLVTGLLVYSMLKRVDNYQVEVLLTLALAMGTYALAEEFAASAPIAVVVCGLFIGNPGRAMAMSKETERYIDGFWELIDEILNAILFLLIGLELLEIPTVPRLILPGLAAIGITLLARYVSVIASLGVSRLWQPTQRGDISVLTWGGLRGGLSIAMALSLPKDEHRDFVTAMAYGVVAFSVFAQGTTVAQVIRHAKKESRPGRADDTNAIMDPA